MTAAIVIDHATLAYRGSFPWTRSTTTAVRDVSLQLSHGKTLGLVGESGSGKTSLAKMCLGIVAPTEGAVTIGGMNPVSHRRKHPGDIQVVLQHPEWSLNPRLTCGVSISEALIVRGRSSRKDRGSAVAEMLDLVGLDSSFANRFPHELSGGQQQRIAIARALVTDPVLVVFDEVVSALDLSVQVQILNLIVRLQRERGFAALFISHDLAAVRYVSSDIAVMYAGRLMEVAAVKSFYGPASHPYTRSLQDAAIGDLNSKFRLVASTGEYAQGCPLASRCPLAVERCRAEVPELRQLGEETVACHRAEDVAHFAYSTSAGESGEDDRTTGGYLPHTNGFAS